MSKLRKSSNTQNAFVVKGYLYLTPSICYQLQNQTNSISTIDFIFVITIDMFTITCYHCLEQVLLTSLWSGCYCFEVILTITCKKYWCCHWFFIACCHAITLSLFIITLFIAPLLFVFVALFIAPPTSCICDIVHCAISIFFILWNAIVVLFSSLFITFLITPSLFITLSWCSNRLSNIVQ